MNTTALTDEQRRTLSGVRFRVEPEGEPPFEMTAVDFVRENDLAAYPDEVRDLLALKVGGAALQRGGGAAPAFEIRRIPPREDFIALGARVVFRPAEPEGRRICRYGDGPWLHAGIEGVVVDYHSDRDDWSGDYAVVRWQAEEGAEQLAISPDSEGRTWARAFGGAE